MASAFHLCAVLLAVICLGTYFNYIYIYIYSFKVYKQ